MREIKFRAWDISENRMLWTKIHDRNWYATPYNDEKGCHCVREKNQRDAHWLEIMQYTGLKDKNGKEIYEGDIITIKDREHGNTTGYIIYHGGGFRVSFDEHAMKFQLENKELPGYNESGSFDALWWMIDSQPGHIGHDTVKAEIIGTIYENPELLKENKNG